MKCFVIEKISECNGLREQEPIRVFLNYESALNHVISVSLELIAQGFISHRRCGICITVDSVRALKQADIMLIRDNIKVRYQIEKVELSIELSE